MKKMNYLSAAVVILALSTGLWAQAVGSNDYEMDVQFSLYGGYFTCGNNLLETYIDDEKVVVDAKNGPIVGVRMGVEQEYFGLELSVAGIFSEVDIDADDAAVVTNDDDLTWLMSNLDLMIFPTGNEIGDGRVRPYIAAGPGVVYVDTDFDGADGELMFDTNVGGGIKFLLGDEGNPVFRIDYRWHYMVGSGDIEDTYFQEITAGIGVRF